MGRGERSGHLDPHNDMAAALLAAGLLALLAAVTVTDLRHRLVPDRALAIGVLFGLALVVVDDPAGLLPRIAWGLAAGAFLLAAAVIRPDGMGLGDVKLAAVLGVYLGSGVAAALVVALAVGSLAGAVILARRGWEARSRTIPFAPFLALGSVVALVSVSPPGG